jgi:hypothetical protein
VMRDRFMIKQLKCCQIVSSVKIYLFDGRQVRVTKSFAQ